MELSSYVLLSKMWIANVSFVRSEGGRLTMDTQAIMQRSETTGVIVVVVVVVSQTKLLYLYIMALLHSGCSNRDGEK
jgi:hypothetical protein